MKKVIRLSFFKSDSSKINGFNTQEIETFLTDNFDTVLSDEVSSISHGFSVKVDVNGFTFVPLLPASFVLDNALYQRIYAVANSILYPFFTVLKSQATVLIQTSDDLNSARGFRFNWLTGIPEQLKINKMSEYVKSIDDLEDHIPIMKNLDFSFNKCYHLAVAGNSGSGKSYYLITLLSFLKEFSEIEIVDPKFDSPARFAKRNQLKCVAPSSENNSNQFVLDVTKLLAENLDLILKRQQDLFIDPDRKFRHKVIVIDEMLALSAQGDKKTKENLFSLINQIALLGRATRVHLVLLSQRFDSNALPTSARAQFSVMLQLGNISKETTQFLFSDLDTNDIAVPVQKGGGICQIIDGEHASNVIPIITPSVLDWS